MAVWEGKWEAMEDDQGTNLGSWDFWWKAKVTPASHDDLRMGSGMFLRSAQWFHWDKSELQLASSGGGFTWIRLTHRRHLNLFQKQIKPQKFKTLNFSIQSVSIDCNSIRLSRWPYLSCVSLDVFSSSLNKSRRSARLKWRSTSSSLSTTHELKAFLCACRWNIFSSIVPV